MCNESSIGAESRATGLSPERIAANRARDNEVKALDRTREAQNEVANLERSMAADNRDFRPVRPGSGTMVDNDGRRFTMENGVRVYLGK